MDVGTGTATLRHFVGSAIGIDEITMPLDGTTGGFDIGPKDAASDSIDGVSFGVKGVTNGNGMEVYLAPLTTTVISILARALELQGKRTCDEAQ